MTLLEKLAKKSSKKCKDCSCLVALTGEGKRICQLRAIQTTATSAMKNSVPHSSRNLTNCLLKMKIWTAMMNEVQANSQLF